MLDKFIKTEDDNVEDKKTDPTTFDTTKTDEVKDDEKADDTTKTDDTKKTDNVDKDTDTDNDTGNDTDTDTGTDTDTDTDAGRKEIPKWIAQLPRSMRLREDIIEEIKDFKTIGELVEDYLDVLDELDNAIVPPSDDASEEEIKEFFEKMGIPEDYKKYEVEAWKTADGEEIDETIREPILKAMHDAKLSKAQAKALYSAMGKVFAKKVEIEQEEAERGARETEEYFRIKWGANYEKNMGAIIDVIHKFGGSELVNAIDKSGLGDNKDFINFMFSVSKNFTEDQLVTGEPPVPEGAGKRILSYPSMKNLGEE